MSGRPTNRDPLVWISLAAGIGFTASAEFQLARTIGAPVPVAVLLPLALDVYVVAAIRRSRGRDIALSLMLMGVAQVVAHILEARVVMVSVPLVAAVSLLVPLVIWRVHALAVLPAVVDDAGTGVEPGTAAGTETVATVERVPASAPPPVPPSSLPELEAVPEQEPTPVPVRQRRRTTPKTPRGTGTRTRRTTSAGTASFDEHVRTATQWLTDDPTLTGTAIGKRLNTGDSYGRRVRRAATGTAAPGPAHRPDHTTSTGTGSSN